MLLMPRLEMPSRALHTSALKHSECRVFGPTQADDLVMRVQVWQQLRKVLPNSTHFKIAEARLTLRKRPC
jgi:hypothetical protein